MAHIFVGPCVGANSTLSDPIAVFKGPTSKEGEGKEKWLGGR